MPEWRWRFLICVGVGALICSLPLAGPLLHLLPGTMLRSPARMLYLSTFCAAVALGAGVDALRAVHWPRGVWVGYAVLAVLLAAHFADLWRFDHWFIQTYPRENEAPEFQSTLQRELGNRRIAEEREDTVFTDGDWYDDAGGFDSIFLARFNRGYVALAGLSADTNEQVFDSSVLPVKALEALGVRFVITTDTRADLPLADKSDDANLYRVANPAPRADFVAAGRVEIATERQIPGLFAAGSWDRLLLEPAAKKYLAGAVDGGSGNAGRVEYSRPSSDEIDLKVESAGGGFAHVLESYDPGWSATVDGAAAAVLAANGFSMAIPVRAGSHAVRLQYATPGRATGVALSLVSLVLLIGLVASVKPSAG